ncbi:hypothetical protein FJZ21_00320 [Candidatus Pacearchaeota archaeon]|nr:hypothetical protein [Candidatus Pacearchaeota archaeon]
MRTSWIIGALVCFLIGYILTTTIVGAILGIPLILLSLFLLIVGIIIPGKRKIVHVYHHKKK